MTNLGINAISQATAIICRQNIHFRSVSCSHRYANSFREDKTKKTNNCYSDQTNHICGLNFDKEILVKMIKFIGNYHIIIPNAYLFPY